jgi:hypothetical protein
MLEETLVYSSWVPVMVQSVEVLAEPLELQ